MGSARTWEDLQDVMSGESVQRLRQVYQRPEDVDMFIGQNMEKSSSSYLRMKIVRILANALSIGRLDPWGAMEKSPQLRTLDLSLTTLSKVLSKLRLRRVVRTTLNSYF